MTGAEPVGTDGVPSTPGLAGYALAVGVSWFLVTLGSGVLVLRDPSLMLDWILLVSLFALGTAPFGVLVVHLACERFDAQWIHVAAAGLVGGLAVLLVDSLLLSGPSFEFWRMALGVGV